MKKKLILFVAFVFSTILIFGQQTERTVERDFVVLEMVTATWCQYCPGAALGAQDLIENGCDVSVIAYHSSTSDPFYTTASGYRKSYYNISSYPTAKFDGVLTHKGGSEYQSLYEIYLPKYEARKEIPSSFKVKIRGENDSLRYDITLILRKVDDYSGDNLKAHLVLTESKIPYKWQWLDTLNYVERKMVPNQYGTTIDFSEEDEIVLELTFTLDEEWVAENCELVAFIQDNDTKEILQANKEALTELKPYVPPMKAGFSVSDTTPCEWSYVVFYDESQGNVDYYYWSFPGGTPDTSNEKDPVVYYKEPGTYDVSLTVSNGLENSTISKEEYMNVQVCTDVAERKESIISLYPNPSNGMFNIIFNQEVNTVSDLKIIDMHGRIVHTMNDINVESGNQFTIDISSLAEGIYYLYLNNENNNYHKKIIIH